MTRMLAFSALIAVSACAESTQFFDNAARRSAKVAVNETIVTRFPGVPTQVVTPFTDCVIDNSNANEIAAFARDAVTGITDITAALVRTVIERPETQSCIVRQGISTLGAG